MTRLKARFQPAPALIDWEPYADPFDPTYPSWAPYSMMGICPVHGLERITRESIGGGSDPTALFHFQCGEIDPASLG